MREWSTSCDRCSFEKLFENLADIVARPTNFDHFRGRREAETTVRHFQAAACAGLALAIVSAWWPTTARAIGPGPDQTPPTLVERVVSRLAGDDVVGAAQALDELAAQQDDRDALERLRLHVGARRGDLSSLTQTLYEAATGSPVASWLLLAASRGLEPADPALAAVVADLARGDDAAGRAARVTLARIFADHALPKRAIEEFEAALGRPWRRLMDVPRKVLRLIPVQQDPAKETERGWLLLDKYSSKAALNAFERALAAKPVDARVRCWARVGAGRAALSQRALDRGMAHLQQAMVLPACAGNPELPEAVVRLARNAFAEGSRDAVVAANTWLSEHAPEWGAQHGVPGLVPLLQPKSSEAKALARVVRKRLKRNRWYDPVSHQAMKAFMKLRKRGKHAQAADLLVPIADAGYRNWRPSLWGQLDYWASRAHWDAGEHGVAVERWARLVERYPQSWYGLLAAAHLRKHRPERMTEVRQRLDKLLADPASQPLAVDDALQARVTGLARYGLVRAIRHELRDAQVLEHPEVAAWGAQALSLAGMPSAGARLAQRAVKLSPTASPAKDPLGLWRAAWPTPFRDTVERAVDVTAASPWFVWGVMRVESLFAPTAVSRAGAKGLLQLMPGTASYLSRVLKDLPADSDDLFDPLDNVLLGSAFLERLANAYHGSKPLMLTAYNAGPGRLRGHIRKLTRGARAVPDVAEFVETLPWNEARHYVRSVVTSWATYRMLYGCRCLSSIALALPGDVIDRLSKKRKRRTKRRRRGRRRR